MQVDVDADLLADAQRVSGMPTPEATIRYALQKFLDDARRQALADLWGIGWDAGISLDEIRRTPRSV